jgi:hypothetical protein
VTDSDSVGVRMEDGGAEEGGGGGGGGGPIAGVDVGGG